MTRMEKTSMALASAALTYLSKIRKTQLVVLETKPIARQIVEGKPKVPK